MAAVDRELAEWVKGAEALVVSLGVDAAAATRRALEFRRRASPQRGGCLRALGCPTVFVQEGGYDLARWARSCAETLLGFEAAR